MIKLLFTNGRQVNLNANQYSHDLFRIGETWKFDFDGLVQDWIVKTIRRSAKVITKKDEAVARHSLEIDGDLFVFFGD